MGPNWFQQQFQKQQQQFQKQQQQNYRNMMGAAWMQQKKKEAEEARRQAQNARPHLPGGVPNPRGLGAFPAGAGSFRGAALELDRAGDVRFVAPETHPVKATFAFLFWLVLSVVAGVLAASLHPIAGVLLGVAGLGVTIRKTAKSYRGD